MLWQSLTPVGTFCDLKHNDFLFVIITSISDGLTFHPAENNL
jgi:hypothetical protein